MSFRASGFLFAPIAMRMKVTDITTGAKHRITLQPDDEHRDGDGITLVELHCGEAAAAQFTMGSIHEFYIGGSLYGGRGNGQS